MKNMFTTLVLLALIGLMGCKDGSSSSTSSEPEPSQILIEVQKSVTVQPSLKAIKTLEPSQTVEPIAISTISAYEARNTFMEMIQHNGDCRLPCVFGATPGETERNTFLEFARRFGDYTTSDFRVYSMDFLDVRDWAEFRCKQDQECIREYLEEIPDIEAWEKAKKRTPTDAISVVWSIAQPEGDGVYRVSGDFSDGFVDIIALDASTHGEEYPGYVFGDSIFNETIQYYMLSQILSNYGSPTDVLLWAWHNSDFPEVGSSWSRISLVLYYSEKGFLIEYMIPTEVIDDQYQGCLSDSILKLTAWNPKKDISLEEVLKKGGSSSIGINELNFGIYKPVEEALNMSQEEFYQLFQDPNYEGCLLTPVDLWPNFD